MKLEKQVCTIEQSKRLLELGIDGSSCFWRHWHTKIPTRDGIENNYTLCGVTRDPLDTSTVTYPAFTAAELGEMLPTGIVTARQVINGNYAAIPTMPGSSDINYAIGCINNMQHTEAQARAAMLIHLLENNHVIANDCNSRIN